MIVDFKSIPNESKLWIFPSSRKFYNEELPEINEIISNFLEKWKDGEQPISCAYQIKYNRFIIVTANDIQNSLNVDAHDSLTALIQEIENKFDIILLDKINVCYKQGEFVQYKDLKDFKKIISNKSVSQKTIVFNNMINFKEELEYNWEINIMDSWLARFFKKK